MLVLSRHAGERIVIEGGIVITILAVQGDRVRVGIEAPQNREIYREELWTAIHGPLPATKPA